MARVSLIPSTACRTILVYLTLYMCTETPTFGLESLTNNRCLKTNTIGFEIDDEKEIIINSNFIALLKNDIKTLARLPPIPGQLNGNFYCSMIDVNVKTSDLL